MNRSGYDEDGDCGETWDWVRWRGAVKSALRGRRGQAFLREMLTAIDDLPEKRLIKHDLVDQYDPNAVCALGAVGRKRRMEGLEKIDEEEEASYIAHLFKIPHALAAEIMWANDNASYRMETPEVRWQRVRDWIVGHIK